MKKRLLLPILWILFSHSFSQAQLLKWSPAFIQESSPTITITADASLGNKGLFDHTPLSDVYVHVGAITNLSTGASDWKYVKFTWATTPSSANAPSSGTNQWTFTINGGLRNFFGITNSLEKVQKIAILFRSGNGNKVLRNDDGSDMYIPVYDAGNFVRIDEPVSKPYFNRTVSTVDKKLGDNITITANANQSADLKIFYNNKLLVSNSASTSISTTTLLSDPGNQKFLVEASFGGVATVKDSLQFFLPGPAVVEPLPAGVQDGVSYVPGDTAAYLVLYAPGKTRVALIGDFNNWTENNESQMFKTPDGQRFWIRIGKLVPGAEYAYQFLIDGFLKVADYNTEKVLDPNHDNSIPVATYPSLKLYPTNKTTGIVSVLQPGKQKYTWKVNDFKRPDKRNLVIYELLIRDFLSNRNFKTLQDTLPYLKRLGINAIGLMPFSEFEGNLSWGYNPNYFFAPDKFYGTENAIKEFIDACHQEGIAVIMDMVMNHAFGSSPHALMYWDGATGKPAADNPWLNADAKHPFNVGYDFNHESQATKDLVARVVRHWLTNYKLDGFRWDLSKGFTQTNNPNNVSAWGSYDATRVAIWKRIFDSTQAVSPGSYCILEHFADNAEERELANYGMMLWGNANYNFAQATMGFTQDADFSSVGAQRRGWDKQHLVGYMESHDEERLMYKNLTFGNQLGSYNTKDSITALKRMGMATAFWAMVPGPKMLWQFGELGFPYSINTCTNGTVNSNCRLDNKPVVWHFYNDAFKRGLFDVYSNLIRLRMNPKFISAFTGNSYSMDASSVVKTLQVNDDSLKILVVGNFDLTAKTATVNFPATGTWYSYLTKTSINVPATSHSITLQAGEYHVYLNRDLSNTLVTSINNPRLPELNVNLSVYPNPSSSQAEIAYFLKETTQVKLELLDMLGRPIDTLFEGKKLAGQHREKMIKDKLNSLKPGTYTILISTPKGKQTIKWVYTH